VPSSLTDRCPTCFKDDGAPNVRAAEDATEQAELARRDRLAAAKLHKEIEPSTVESDFPSILLKSTGDPATDDFVEVHVYGAFNRRSVERMLGKMPRRKADQILIADLRRKLKFDGLSIPVETYA
jgi:hypothetical protein